MEVLVLLGVGILIVMLVGAICGIVAVSRQSDILQRLDALEEQVSSQRARLIQVPSRESAPQATSDATREPEPPVGSEPAPSERPEPQPSVAARSVAPEAATPAPTTPILRPPAEAAAKEIAHTRPQPESVVLTAADLALRSAPAESGAPASSGLAASDSAAMATPAPPALPEVPVAAPAPAELPVAIPADKPRVEAAAPEAGSTDWLRQFEERVGKRWMTWLGVLALVIGALFFLQYAVRQGWIIPPLRIGMAVLLGVALVVIGGRFLRRQMRALGQGLIGGGLAILYGAFYAAFAMYHLMPQPVSFAAMVAVSGLGLFLAVRHDALPVSFIAVLGGFITPLILRSGENQRDLLFTYLLVLDLTVLAVAFFRQWAALLTLSFLGTTALFLGWFGAYYEPTAMVPTLLWLGAFYMAFLLMPFAQHFARRRALDAEQFAAAHVAAVCAFIMAARILWPDHEHALGFIALGMSALYAALGVFSRLRVAEDRRSLLGFSLLSMTLLTLSVPLHFGLNGVTVAWAFEGPALVALGCLFRYRPVRVGGFIVLGVAMLRIFVYHWPMHETAFTPFLNPTFAAVMLVPLAAAGCVLVQRVWRAEESELDSALELAAILVGGVLATVLVDAEVRLWITHSAVVPAAAAGYWKFSLDVAVWTLSAAGFLLFGSRLKHDAGRAATIFMLTVAFIFATLAYGQTAPDNMTIFLNLRFACVASAVVLLFLYARLGAKAGYRDSVASAIVAGYLAPLLLIVEVHAWPGWSAHIPYGTLDYWRLSCDTLILAVVSLLFTTVGHRHRVAAYRIAAWPLLLVAFVVAACAYGEYRPRDTWLFLNLRFLAAATVVAGVFAISVARRRLAESGVTPISIIAGILATLLVDVELRQWLDRTDMVAGQFRTYWQFSADAFVWAVGACAFLAAGSLGRNYATRLFALPMLVLAAVLAVVAYSQTAPKDALLFINPRFIAGAATLAVAFAFAAIARRAGEPGASAVAVIAGLLTILLVDVELRLWLLGTGIIDRSLRDYWLFSIDSILWGVGAAVFLTLGGLLRSAAGRYAAAPAAAVALILWIAACGTTAPAHLSPFLNIRFLAVALTTAFIFVFAEVHRRIGESQVVVPTAITAGYLAMAAIDVEMAMWIGLQPASSWARCDYYIVCAHMLAVVAGAAGFLLAGLRLSSRAAVIAGMVPQAGSCILALIFYAQTSPASDLLCVNARFILTVLAAGLLFFYAAPLRSNDEHREFGAALTWCAIPFLLLILSIEDYLFWTQRAGLEPHRAGWIAQMSLSLVWGMYATALLAVGFWRRNRALRFCGLALFGITALKLVIIDIAHVHQIYRIISFLVLGVLMIAASYLYHRIEKRLED